MNRLKTVLILGIMTGLVLATGYYLGGQQGALVALFLSAVFNIGSYWFSDRIVLKMYGAKEAQRSEHPELYKIVQELALKAQIPMPRVYVVNMPIANAFATGRNPEHAVVAVTTGILKILDKRELKGVLAHEISHVNNRDILVSGIATTLAGALSYIAQVAYYSSHRRDGGGVGMLIFLILTPIMATLLQLAISRSREYMADSTGARLIGDSHGLANALRKLEEASKHASLPNQPKYEATAHLFIANPFRKSLLTRIFSTHPPMEERIRRLESMDLA